MFTAVESSCFTLFYLCYLFNFIFKQRYSHNQLQRWIDFTGKLDRLRLKFPKFPSHKAKKVENFIFLGRVVFYSEFCFDDWPMSCFLICTGVRKMREKYEPKEQFWGKNFTRYFRFRPYNFPGPPDVNKELHILNLRQTPNYRCDKFNFFSYANLNLGNKLLGIKWGTFYPTLSG